MPRPAVVARERNIVRSTSGAARPEWRAWVRMKTPSSGTEAVRTTIDQKDRRSLTVEFVPQRSREIAALYAPLRQRGAEEIAERYSESDLAVIVDYLTRSNDMLRDLATSLTEGPAAHNPQDAPGRS